ncbi:DMSO/TMAO reductase YedYZ molybdopterin-dependent catalytic subunit [Nocardioides luteus]|uniref:Oxidoreductase n=1 Tax=Nocardioides luteus TaxID=1844 RepID=A0ABQ5SSZ4_9ACTN|nr:molybdopterin-dependent oxidoreductase [Nocardioides luteus]MDR7309976.1 DMSO/TMAO reductase YedYZ molybdopterin-dependent catalytic subunit [Nocardioides luteus]GGR59226.1 oxidoreductase [Nocardioides luteus]GLJ67115.1 oxidoreductase [Nocardioides luteus]
MTSRKLPSGPVAGIAAGVLGLGVAELIAALARGASPLLALGDRVIDLTPRWLKEAAVSTFGTADKPILLASVALVTLVLLGAAGALAVRRPLLGAGMLVLLGAVDIAALLADRAGNGTTGIVALLIGLAVGITALVLLTRQIPDTATPGATTGTASEATAPDGFDRRKFLTAAAAVTAVGAAGGIGAKVVTGRRHPSAKVAIPSAVSPAAPLAEGAALRIDGLTPFVTPVEDFYRIDIALLTPRVDLADYRLKIHGMVDKPVELTYEDLLAMPLYERRVTICCVSNEVGGDLIGNATWTGVRIRDVLKQAGIDPDADAVKSSGADGITIGTPLEALTDGRDALLAIAQNGEPLTQDHGFPVRMVVPGLYGYVSATKWLTDLEVTRFDDFRAYWTDRGWSAEGPIKTQCRIDIPGDDVMPGERTIAGVAWAQHRGVSKVEVRIDDGPWQPATLAAEDSIDTWRQWTYRWAATEGEHHIQARAYDRTGTPQTADEAPPAPNGATGYPTRTVTVG